MLFVIYFSIKNFNIFLLKQLLTWIYFGLCRWWWWIHFGCRWVVGYVSGYILRRGGWWWVYFGWWWVVVDIFWMVVGGDGWWWVVA